MRKVDGCAAACACASKAAFVCTLAYWTTLDFRGIIWCHSWTMLGCSLACYKES